MQQQVALASSLVSPDRSLGGPPPGQPPQEELQAEGLNAHTELAAGMAAAASAACKNIAIFGATGMTGLATLAQAIKAGKRVQAGAAFGAGSLCAPDSGDDPPPPPTHTHTHSAWRGRSNWPSRPARKEGRKEGGRDP